MEQVENRVSGIKDKVKELDQSDKDKEGKKSKKIQMEYTRFWDTIKRPSLRIMGIEV
jgi:hypothetical protein